MKKSSFLSKMKKELGVNSANFTWLNPLGPMASHERNENQKTSKTAYFFLGNFNPNDSPLSFIKDLVWGGMTSYRDKNGNFQYYDSFMERFPNSGDRNRIESVIKNESDGNNAAKSQKCP